MSSSLPSPGERTPVLHARALSKSYIMYPSEARRLLAMVTGRSNGNSAHHALKQIDLKVYPGECVGIVGRNGAGKSTLLQLICGILEPTSGSVTVHGRISPLLELASGFSPDFTGRENVYQKATILGLSHRQTQERFDQIEKFANIGDFLDRPVRTYSSGMLARLAFAVAIHVDADLLVLDEILAVGDAAFQRKCHARIAQLREAGTAILLVSHSTGAITSACDRAILIERGRCLLEADPKTVVSWYHRLLDASPKDESGVCLEIQRVDKRTETAPTEDLSDDHSGAPAQIQTKTKDKAAPPTEPRATFNPTMVPESVIEWDHRGARIQRVRIEDQNGRQVNILTRQQRYQLVYDVIFDRDVPYARFGMLIRNTQGLNLYGCTSAPHGQGTGPVLAGEKLTVRFQFRTALANSAYFCCAGVLGPASEDEPSEEIYLHRVFDAAIFRVHAAKSPITAGFADLGENLEHDPYGEKHCSIERSIPELAKPPV